MADTLAEATGVVALDEGLGGVAAQAPTEIATMAATLALTTTDEDRIYGTSGRGVLGRPHSGEWYWASLSSEPESRVRTPLPSAFMTRRELTPVPRSKCL